MKKILRIPIECARWHAVYGSLVAVGVQNHLLKVLRLPHGDNLQKIVLQAEQVADEVEEAWEKNHENNT